MEIDWRRIFQRDLLEKSSTSYSGQEEERMTAENMISRPRAPSLTSSSMALTIPSLSTTSSLHDFTDYFHVFDEDEEGGSREGSTQDYQSSTSALLSTPLPHLLFEQDHQQESLQQQRQGKSENSPARYIYNSEKIDSSQPSSPLNSPGAQWTVQAVDLIMKNAVDPVGKVISSLHRTSPTSCLHSCKQFLRDLCISPADVIQLNIMPYLEQVPSLLSLSHRSTHSVSEGSKESSWQVWQTKTNLSN
jgi:hypothetical protein